MGSCCNDGGGVLSADVSGSSQSLWLHVIEEGWTEYYEGFSHACRRQVLEAMRAAVMGACHVASEHAHAKTPLYSAASMPILDEPYSASIVEADDAMPPVEAAESEAAATAWRHATGEAAAASEAAAAGEEEGAAALEGQPRR